LAGFLKDDSMKTRRQVDAYRKRRKGRAAKIIATVDDVTCCVLLIVLCIGVIHTILAQQV
jgi:hypothetical protein